MLRSFLPPRALDSVALLKGLLQPPQMKGPALFPLLESRLWAECQECEKDSFTLMVPLTFPKDPGGAGVVGYSLL